MRPPRGNRARAGTLVLSLPASPPVCGGPFFLGRGSSSTPPVCYLLPTPVPTHPFVAGAFPGPSLAPRRVPPPRHA